MRDMTLVLRQHLKRHDWPACSSVVNQDATLIGAVDSGGSSLLNYAVRDSRWMEAQWLLDNGWGWADVRKSFSQHVIDLSDMPRSWLHDLVSSPHDGELCLSLSLVRSYYISEGLSYIKKSVFQNQDWVCFWAEYSKDFDVDIASQIWPSCGEMGEARSDSLLQVALAGVRRNRWDMLGWSYGLGLDIEELDRLGSSLLGVAVKLNRLDMVEWIVGAGAPVDMLDGNGHTALYLAVASGSMDCVNFLIHSGAKPDLRQGKNGQGNSPIRLASKSSRSAVRAQVFQAFETEILNRTAGSAPILPSGTRSKRL